MLIELCYATKSILDNHGECGKESRSAKLCGRRNSWVKERSDDGKKQKLLSNLNKYHTNKYIFNKLT
jgi:hypothetical protein